MRIDVIGMPMYYGCDVKGSDESFDTINDKGIFNKFNNKSKIVVNQCEKHLNDKKLKYVEEIMNSNKRLYNSVTNSLSKGNLPLVIGGDHSSVIGSISSVLDYYNNDVTVIWIDSHTDIHTEKDTPSGNIHGLPVAVCMGLCDERFNIGNNKLKNIIYIGIGNYEEEEMNRIKENNIKYYTDKDVNDDLNGIVKEVISSIKTKYVHISFDLDVFKYNEFKAVNVAVEKSYLSNGGISVNDGITILKELLTNLNISSMDIVEYNPLLDNENDIKSIERIIDTIDTYL
jgi:arginase